MTMEWLEFAISDSEAIFNYIAVDNSLAAVTIDERIEKAVESLSRFPDKGGRAELTEHES